MKLLQQTRYLVLGICVMLLIGACGSTSSGSGTSTPNGSSTTATTATNTPASKSTASGNPIPAGFDRCTLATQDEISTATGVTVTSIIAPGDPTCLYNFADANHELGIAVNTKPSADKAHTLFTTFCFAGSQSISGIGDEACANSFGGAMRIGANLVQIAVINQTFADNTTAIKNILTLITPRLP